MPTFTLSFAPTSLRVTPLVTGVTVVTALELKVLPEILLFNVKLSSTFVVKSIALPVYLYCVFFMLTVRSFASLSFKSFSLELADVFLPIVIVNVIDPV